MNYEDFIFDLMDRESAVHGGAILGEDGSLIYQTENWDISEDVSSLSSAIEEAVKEGKNPGKLSIQNLSFMVVEFVPERIIGTNVTRKGHVIVAPTGKGKSGLICFVNPQTSPRDALLNVQEAADKLKTML